MPKENKVAEPITLAAFAAGATIVSAGFTVLGFFMQRSENRRIIGLLSQIKTYVYEIDKKTDEIIKQNKEILSKLDQLPSIIKRLIREETLNVKYSNLDAIRNEYFLLPSGDSQYVVHTVGWQKLSEVITFIIKHEFRISKALDILQVCEFTVIATRLIATPILDNLITSKIQAYNEVKEELQHKVITAFEELYSLFSNTSFISQHNFNKDLPDVSELKYTLQLDKPTTETYQERVRNPRSGGGGRDGGAESVTYSTVARTRPDKMAIKFNTEKTIYSQEVLDKIALFNEAVKNYRELRDVVKSFEFYLKIINEDFSKQVSIPKFFERKTADSEYFTKLA